MVFEFSFKATLWVFHLYLQYCDISILVPSLKNLYVFLSMIISKGKGREEKRKEREGEKKMDSCSSQIIFQTI